MSFFQGDTGLWEVVIGLEVHAQIASDKKLFSFSNISGSALPNQDVSLFDAGIPGTLPVLNTFCILQAVKSGIALHGNINKYSEFDRKSYFYPDLPNGYQITQFFHPIVTGGYIDISLNEEGLDSFQKPKKRITIDHIHLEQDAGKIVHCATSSYIDFNRAGVPLMEIVTNPDMRSSKEVVDFLHNLRLRLMYAGTCHGNMESGHIRCDANVSVRRVDDENFGVRCEIKNLNSMRNVATAIEYEARRQISILESGGSIVQSTMAFDADTGVTSVIRAKCEALDYRYFKDPDLLPVVLSDEYVSSVVINEMPDEKLKRYVEEYGLSVYDANVLINSDMLIVSFFEDLIDLSIKPKVGVKWVTIEIFGLLKKKNIDFADFRISARYLADLIMYIDKATISENVGKAVLVKMFDTGKSAIQIIEEDSLMQISDKGLIRDIVSNVIKDHHEKVVQYKAGNGKLYSFFVGQIMKATSGNGNPKIINEILREKLEEIS